VHYLLSYEIVPDYVERRAAHRDEHLALARAAVTRGELVLGGAAGEPIDGAVLLFQGESPATAEAFAVADPYVKNGLVTSWRVRPWATVVGAEAAVRVQGAPSAPHSTQDLSRSDLVRFLRSSRHWVVSSIADDGRPQSAVVGVAVTDSLELVFDTMESTNKARNIRRDARVSLVMWAAAATAQVEGAAELLIGAELERLQAVYFEQFPDGRERVVWPGIAYVRLRPSWLRTSDFGGANPIVLELDEAALRSLSD
jgi:uncharacterized protein